jgi:hypothetical protein
MTTSGFKNTNYSFFMLLYFSGQAQGCQVVYFQTKNPKFGKFWSILQ